MKNRISMRIPLVAALLFIVCNQPLSAQKNTIVWASSTTALPGGIRTSVSSDATLMVSTSARSCYLYALPSMSLIAEVAVPNLNAQNCVCFSRHDSAVTILCNRTVITYRVPDLVRLDSIEIQNFEGLVSVNRRIPFFSVFNDSTHELGIFYTETLYRQPDLVLAVIIDMQYKTVRERIMSNSNGGYGLRARNSIVCIRDSSNELLWQSVPVFDTPASSTIRTSFPAQRMASNGRVAFYADSLGNIGLYDFVTKTERWRAVIQTEKPSGFTSNETFHFVNDTTLLMQFAGLANINLRNGSIRWQTYALVDVLVSQQSTNQCICINECPLIGRDCADYMPSVYEPLEIHAASMSISDGASGVRMPPEYMEPRVTNAEFCHDESNVAITSTRGETYICSATSGAVWVAFSAKGKLSADGKSFVQIHGETVTISDCATSRVKRRFDLTVTGSVVNYFVTPSSPSQLVVVSSEAIFVFDTADGHQVSKTTLVYNGIILETRLVRVGRAVVVVSSHLDALIVGLDGTTQSVHLNTLNDSIASAKVEHISESAHLIVCTIHLINRMTQKVSFSGTALYSLTNAQRLFTVKSYFGICNSCISAREQFLYWDYHYDPIFRSNAMSILRLEDTTAMCQTVEYEARNAEGGFPRCSHRIVSNSGRYSLMWMDCATPVVMEQLCDSATVDVENAEVANAASLQPNPAEYTVTIVNPFGSVAHIDLVNEMGLSQIQTSVEPSSSVRVDVRSLASGLYYVVLVTRDGSYTRQLIVVH